MMKFKPEDVNFYREEYQAHIEEKKCPKGVCSAPALTAPHSTQEVNV